MRALEELQLKRDLKIAKTTITLSEGVTLRTEACLVLFAVPTSATEMTGRVKIVPIDSNFEGHNGVAWRNDTLYIIPQRLKIRAESSDIDMDIWRFYD